MPTSCGWARSASSTSSTWSSGHDGSIAGLFPRSPALDADPGQLVTFSEDPSGVQPARPPMTITYAGIARARLAIFTVERRTQARPWKLWSPAKTCQRYASAPGASCGLVGKDAAPRAI